MSLMAFHGAIAGAAVTEAALYTTHYRERFLGMPQANPEGYACGSIVNEAAILERPLLLIYGLVDD